MVDMSTIQRAGTITQTLFPGGTVTDERLQQIEQQLEIIQQRMRGWRLIRLGNGGLFLDTRARSRKFSGSNTLGSQFSGIALFFVLLLRRAPFLAAIYACRHYDNTH